MATDRGRSGIQFRGYPEVCLTVTAEPYTGDSPRTGNIIFRMTGLNAGESIEAKITVTQYSSQQTIGIKLFEEDEDWNISGDTDATVTIVGFSSDIDWNFK